MAARANASSLFLITSPAITGVMIAIVSVVVGNALTHRKNNPLAHWMGRVVQTPGFLSTSRSIIGQYKMTWDFEKEYSSKRDSKSGHGEMRPYEAGRWKLHGSSGWFTLQAFGTSRTLIYSATLTTPWKQPANLLTRQREFFWLLHPCY